MPRIEDINYKSHISNHEGEYLLDQSIGDETIEQITKFIAHHNDVLSQINDVINRYLDTESCVINGQPILNKLTIKIKADIEKYEDKIQGFKTTFSQQVTNHKTREAKKTYKEVMKIYKENIETFRSKLTNYNNTRLKDEDGDGEKETTLPYASFTAGTEATPTITFEGGKSGSSEEQELRNSFKELILGIYDPYVVDAVILDNKYGGNIIVEKANLEKSPFEKFTNISEDRKNPEKSKTTSTTSGSKTKSTLVGNIYDTDIYIKNGKCYTKDKAGIEHEVYYYDKDGKKQQLTEKLFNSNNLSYEIVLTTRNNKLKTIRDTSSIKKTTLDNVIGYVDDTNIYTKDGVIHTMDKAGNEHKAYYFKNGKQKELTEEILNNKDDTNYEIYITTNDNKLKTIRDTSTIIKY